MINIAWYDNSKALAEFSKRTGIIDGKVDVLVKDASLAFNWDGGVTTTAPLRAMTRFSDSVSAPVTVANIEDMLKAVERASVRPDPRKCPGMYGGIYWNFQVARPPWFSHLRGLISEPDDLDEEREELPSIAERWLDFDIRELYENEWKLEDILHKDGWIPRED